MFIGVTFNVLAPCWAHPAYYPEEAHLYLDRVYRRGKIINVLKSLVRTTDCFCLQEVTPEEFEHFREGLPQFIGVVAFHSPDYWSDHLTREPPWEPNGVALFVRRDSFDNLSFVKLENETGNCALYGEGIHFLTKKRVGMVCLHLDSDSHERRVQELRGILQFIKSREVQTVLIGGDFNCTMESISHILEEHKFIDALQAIGNRSRTCPDSSCQPIIDHLLIRGAFPEDGDVLDHNLWDYYSTDNEARVSLNFQLVGSDHFPVWGRFSY